MWRSSCREERLATSRTSFVECKKDGISDSEFSQAIEQAFGNANSLRVPYAAVVAGNTRRFYDVGNHPASERTKKRNRGHPRQVRSRRSRNRTPQAGVRSVGRLYPFKLRILGNGALCLLFIHPRAPNLISFRSVLPQLSVGGQPVLSKNTNELKTGAPGHFDRHRPVASPRSEACRRRCRRFGFPVRAGKTPSSNGMPRSRAETWIQARAAPGPERASRLRCGSPGLDSGPLVQPLFRRCTALSATRSPLWRKRGTRKSRLETKTENEASSALLDLGQRPPPEVRRYD